MRPICKREGKGSAVLLPRRVWLVRPWYLLDTCRSIRSAEWTLTEITNTVPLSHRRREHRIYTPSEINIYKNRQIRELVNHKNAQNEKNETIYITNTIGVDCGIGSYARMRALFFLLWSQHIMISFLFRHVFGIGFEREKKRIETLKWSVEWYDFAFCIAVLLKSVSRFPKPTKKNQLKRKWENI